MSKYILILYLTQCAFGPLCFADSDPARALKRAQYLLNGSIPDDKELGKYGKTKKRYRERLRDFLEDKEGFYKASLRYHEKEFGVGLGVSYIDELREDDQSKFAKITCGRNSSDERLRCFWASAKGDENGRNSDSSNGNCPLAWEEPASVFWYPGIVAWVCPSVIQTCGHDLSRCFIESEDKTAAENSEMGSTELFDSRHSVIKSLSKQSAGIATRLAVENYPYTYIFRSGLSAVDNAVVHFYRQTHHFRIDDLHLSNETKDIVNNVNIGDSKFSLINTGPSYEQSGVISTFGYLRRYDKNRTRANELYERVLCRKFTSELPRVFPQDPGNLRETEGCSGCHATLDPLADFFLSWGEGAGLYGKGKKSTETYFANKTGEYLSDLGEIVGDDTAFATCTTMKVWEWLMGRQFYFSEAELRGALANYFVNSNYSFRELVYAIASHPAFIERERSDGVVPDPLEEPPLGTIPESVERECAGTESYSDFADLSEQYCESCHNGSGGRTDLRDQDGWEDWGSQAVNLMGSGQMPPGQFGPQITEFKETVRCWLENN